MRLTPLLDGFVSAPRRSRSTQQNKYRPSWRSPPKLKRYKQRLTHADMKHCNLKCRYELDTGLGTAESAVESGSTKDRQSWTQMQLATACLVVTTSLQLRQQTSTGAQYLITHYWHFPWHGKAVICDYPQFQAKNIAVASFHTNSNINPSNIATITPHQTIHGLDCKPHLLGFMVQRNPKNGNAADREHENIIQM